ncbi:MAG: DUF4174 domain-containing protein [Janthinobacterium lividum]
MDALYLLFDLLKLVVSLPNRRTPLAKVIRAAKRKQQVLLVTAPNSQNAPFQAQKELLGAASKQLREHNVLVLHALHTELSHGEKSYLDQYYDLLIKRFEVVLIDKDGNVKRRSYHPLTPTALLTSIDQMPMCQQEMRRKR